MTLSRVTYENETGYAYIYVAQPRLGISPTGVPLEQADEGDPEALRQIVLDFDADGYAPRQRRTHSQTDFETFAQAAGRANLALLNNSPASSNGV